MARRRLRAFPAHAFLALLLPPAVTLGKEQCARAEPREGAPALSRTAPGVPRPWVRPGGRPGRNSASAGTHGEGTRRPAGGTGVTCPTPTSVEHAAIRVKSYNLSSRERYTCNPGFKRKAGTSSLTECVFNKTTNIAYWTTPNLKCIRDPSLTHQRPVPPSTVVTARVTPQPESPSPSGKGLLAGSWIGSGASGTGTGPATFSPESDTTVATGTAIVPGSQLMPSTSPSTGTTGIGSHESSQAPSQTTTKTLEPTPSIFHETTGAYPSSSREVTVAISTSVSLLGVVCVGFLLVCCLRPRQTSQPPGVETETTEAMPMTGRTGSQEEDTENYPPDL